jgi:AcrR family transcriptional regulator
MPKAPAKVERATPRPLGRPPAADGAVTRRAIVSAASRRLAAVGYDAMTLDDIAAEVGITRAAIYRYFRSKRQLARAVVLESNPDIDALFAELSVGAETLADQLRALVRATVQVTLKQPDEVLGYFQMGRLSDHDEELAKVFRDRSAGIRRMVRELVDEADGRGELAGSTMTPDDVVEAMSGLVWAMTSGAAEANTPTTRAQVVLAVELVLQRPPWEAPAGTAATRSGARRPKQRAVPGASAGGPRPKARTAR